MLVKPRRSANSTATSCSLPWLTSPPNKAFWAVTCGGSNGWMVTGPVGPRLAGQAHARRGVDAGQHALLLLQRRRQRFGAFDHAHAAGGAAAAPAADRGMGDAADAAGFEQAGAGLDDDALAVGIGDRDGAAARVASVRTTRATNTPPTMREERDHQPVAQAVEERDLILATAC